VLSGASLACMRLRVLQELQPENWISNGSCYTVMLKPPGLDTVLNKVRGWAPPGREGGGGTKLPWRGCSAAAAPCPAAPHSLGRCLSDPRR